MPTFLHTGLLFGMALAALPVLIHLINLLRHRRVEWAAMEFLLESQKKNRRSVLLRELLLLLMRMAAICLVVLIVAQPMLADRWEGLLGGARMHHVVLLDDSYSMSERWAQTSAFERAKSAVKRIAAQAATRGTDQTFTLVRLSRVRQSLGEPQPDLLQQQVSVDLETLVEGVLGDAGPSQLATSPSDALTSLEGLLAELGEGERVLYLVSDFRQRDWQNSDAARKTLADMQDDDVQLQFVRCSESSRPNVAISSLTTRPGTRAAGVPLMMDIEVVNYGDQPLSDVTVQIHQDGVVRPAVVLESIAAKASETRRFSLLLAEAGQHVITARLEADALAPDDLRYEVVDVPADVKVLVIDGDPAGMDGRFLNLALSPGGNIRTGLSVQLEQPAFLNHQSLDPFASIYLANVESLDQASIDALERFVRGGGGVAIFMGPRCDEVFYNQRLWRDGQGMMPMPLEAPRELLVDRLRKTPDLEVGDHPIFSIFAGQRNSFVRTVTVQRYLGVPAGWEPDTNTEVLARLRNDAPLVVARRLGEGRVISVLTTLSPLWNNWGRNPSFVVMLLELQAWLASAEADESPRVVGPPVAITLDPAHYTARVQVEVPQEDGYQTESFDAVPDGEALLATFNNTTRAGVYDLKLTRIEGQSESRRLALNVDAAEGDLHLIAADQLRRGLPNIHYTMHEADVFAASVNQLAGTPLSTTLLYALAALLIGEQFLAYLASYHTSLARAPKVQGAS